MKQRVAFTIQLIGISILLLSLMIGCGRRQVEVDLSAEDRFQRGMRFYQDGNYSRAIDEFRIVTRQFSGSDYADDAQFYMGMAYFQRGEYILAANEFDIMVNTMGGSPLIPEAQYYLALSYYNLSPRFDLDQEYTHRAIEEFQTFIDFFPTHERVPEAESKIRELTNKLARKEYENARLYMRMRYYRAATRYFQIVIDRYHDTPFIEHAYIGKVEALIERNMFDEANETVQRFLRQFPNSDLRPRAQLLERRIASALENQGDDEAANGPDAARLPETVEDFTPREARL